MEDFNTTITFPVRNGKIDYGNARNICFGCGETASNAMTIYYEEERGGKTGLISGLFDRKIIEIPVCKNCKKIIWTYRLRILFWGMVFLAITFGGMYISMEIFHIEKSWPVFIIMGVAIFPVYMIKKNWKFKDCGGAIVNLTYMTDISITLSFSNPIAYNKIHTGKNL